MAGSPGFAHRVIKMIWRYLRSQDGVSRVEHCLYLACFGVWCVIGLETLGAVGLRS
jgi:Flp pilus assembly pilin Flp